MTPGRRFLLGFTLLFAVLGRTVGDDMPQGKPNRLAKESSPYLLQHAHNPVDWHPWGPEAFAQAKKDGKLVFLSVGYSACHWCHVMEKQSFSNPAVAKILNEHFVCIKVDREERPDVDDVYMAALNVTGNPGGWPMSMFLTDDGKPIFGGTYWPPDDREVDGQAIPGFKSVLNSVIELHRDKRKELLAQADAVAERVAAALDRAGGAVAVVPLNADLVRSAATAFDFDPEHGGVGSKLNKFRGTKFPKPPALKFLLLGPTGDDAKAARAGVFRTLDHMAAGGIYDHLGGGFHRYSTERTWTVPHFEKMLYDNAQLVELYAEAYALDPKPEYARVVRETLDFVQRELTSPDGVFYSALDADSEGEEGRFYVWTPAELAAVLDDGDAAKSFRAAYLSAGPNFEEKYHILRRPDPTVKVNEAVVGPVMAKLFAAREKRERPFLDTKVLCGWNGLMIAGYARAGELFKEPKYTAAAEKAADFILTRMRGDDGRLNRVFAGPPGGTPTAYGTAFLDDYADLTHGLLALHRATGDAKWLREARSVTDTMLTWYADPEHGGFFTTPSDGETLFARGKDSYDGVVPSGNGMAAMNLVRLGIATGEEKYRAAAGRTFRDFAGTIRVSPQSSPTMTEALAVSLAKTGDKAGTTPPDKPAANPKSSADVVKMTVGLTPPTPGGQQVIVTLTVAEPWHVYANPPGGADLEAAATRLVLTRNGEPVAVEWAYPAGDKASDSVAGEYRIYQGEVRITGTIPAGPDGPIAVKAHVLACRDGTCLLPGTATATTK